MTDAKPASLQALANAFDARLQQEKSAVPNVEWYPYRSMNNVEHVADLLPGDLVSRLEEGLEGMRVLDIGPADGDLGYFFESRGAQVDFLDFATTNYNNLDGIKGMKGRLSSNATIIEQDIDRQFNLEGNYDFAIALGLLYHLRNPMYFLMQLAHHANAMILSTRVIKYFPDGTEVGGSSAAYFLECRESNNDPTNYFAFTPKGLTTLLKRCGWRVISSKCVGEAESDPVNKDQRMFVYCERVDNWADLYRHHDF